MGRHRVRKWFVAESDEPGKSVKSWVSNMDEQVLFDVAFWIPSTVIMVLVDGTWKSIIEPFLPGYVLVSSFKGYSHLESVLDVELLRFGGPPLPLTIEEVIRLRMFEEVERYIVEHSFTPGQEVLVRSDARSSYAGMKAVFISLLINRNGYYAKIHLLLCDAKDMVVNVPYDHLMPCTKENSKGERTPRVKSSSLQDGTWTGLKTREENTKPNIIRVAEKIFHVGKI